MNRLNWLLLCGISFNAGFYVHGLLLRDRIRAESRQQVESAIRYCVESGLLTINHERLGEMDEDAAPKQKPDRQD